MRSLLAVLLVPLALGGCVADGPPYPAVGLAPEFYRPPVDRSCENYADQTARNTYENISDNEDSFGVASFNRTRALREGDDAYQRCRPGRLN